MRATVLARACGLCQCPVCTGGASGYRPLRPAHEVDHTLPLWAGGADAESNMQALNADCHKAKTQCEAAMRAAGGYDPTRCTCGRHTA